VASFRGRAFLLGPFASLAFLQISAYLGLRNLLCVHALVSRAFLGAHGYGYRTIAHHVHSASFLPFVERLTAQQRARVETLCLCSDVWAPSPRLIPPDIAGLFPRVRHLLFSSWREHDLAKLSFERLETFVCVKSENVCGGDDRARNYVGDTDRPSEMLPDSRTAAGRAFFSFLFSRPGLRMVHACVTDVQTARTDPGVSFRDWEFPHMRAAPLSLTSVHLARDSGSGTAPSCMLLRDGDLPDSLLDVGLRGARVARLPPRLTSLCLRDSVLERPLPDSVSSLSLASSSLLRSDAWPSSLTCLRLSVPVSRDLRLGASRPQDQPPVARFAGVPL